jgi:hypothetical protein
MSELTITFESSIPDEVINEFAENLPGHFDITVQKNEPQTYFGRVSHFESAAIEHIFIFLRDNSDAILAGLISNTVFNLVLFSVKNLWITTSKPEVRTETKPVKIKWRIVDKNQGLEIEFDGNVSAKQADDTVERLKDYLISDRYKADLNTPDYLNNYNDVHLIYNKDLDIWETENFGEKRRRDNELKDEFRRKFRS